MLGLFCLSFAVDNCTYQMPVAFLESAKLLIFSVLCKSLLLVSWKKPRCWSVDWGKLIGVVGISKRRWHQTSYSRSPAEEQEHRLSGLVICFVPGACGRQNIPSSSWQGMGAGSSINSWACKRVGWGGKCWVHVHRPSKKPPSFVYSIDCHSYLGHFTHLAPYISYVILLQPPEFTDTLV